VWRHLVSTPRFGSKCLSRQTAEDIKQQAIIMEKTMQTLLISRACHLQVAVESSSDLNPDNILEPISPNIGVRWRLAGPGVWAISEYGNC